MPDLLSQLQSAVGDTYRLEEELGGGGMSRVFLAEEVALGRKVVIKVLPPEMAAEVSKDRFQREIQLAAKLQHPHVVSLLTAGSGDDLLYYVMPYIEGESLRSKLHREGELPLGEAVKILKEVIDALAYAHEQGVVHRDIKPDNVMISGRHALVTDFGVAKAVTTSGSGTSLTSLGIALGTPAYMAPEQAAADPHTDHRADIYAVGTLAYEMLTGEPPFTGPTPQAVMGKHMTESPEPVSKRRPAVSDVLQSLVMRCLAKRPADRWQSAAELLPQLEALTTPSGGVTPTGTQPVAATSAESMLRKSAPGRVVALFATTAVAVLAATYILVMQLGLPYWVLWAAGVLLALSLPVVILTGHSERRRASARLTGVVADDAVSKSGQWFTWRKTMIGTAVAGAGLVVVTVVYMAMRMFGIGPAGTLTATGQLELGATVILADFTDNTGDSALAMTVTDAFAIDLAQSDVISLMQPAEIQYALERMTLESKTKLTVDVALDMAVREGAGAVIGGDVNRAGGAYVLSARLLEPGSGDVIEAFRETARDSSELIGAIDRLSKGFRQRVGESLRSLRNSPRLDFATTHSLDALRLFTQAFRLINDERDWQRARPMLEQAIEIDPEFAAAHRKIGTELWARGMELTRRNEAFTRAFELRERLSGWERAMVEASYYRGVLRDRATAANVLQAYYDRNPGHFWVLNNLALDYSAQRRWSEAERLLQILIDSLPDFRLARWNIIRPQVAQGKFEAAHRSLELYAERFPDYLSSPYWRSSLSAAAGDYEEAKRYIRELREANSNNRTVRLETSYRLALYAMREGRLADAERFFVERIELANSPAAALGRATTLASVYNWLRQQPEAAMAIVNEQLARFPMDSIPPNDRPYLNLADHFVFTGQVDRAKSLFSEYEDTIDPAVRETQTLRFRVAGHIASAEGDHEEALRQYRTRDDMLQNPVTCLWDIAEAYDRLGNTDSTLAVLTRFVETPYYGKYTSEAWSLAPTLKRLGELHEERGDIENAVRYYNEFVELWNDADPELQPQVADVRERIARLVGEG